MTYKNLFSKTISINVSFLLIFQQSIMAGEIVSDITANSSFQATVEKAPNGIPVVNIVKPNETGLSHNKFSDYNVNKEGAILNNSNQKEVNSQLAGYIYGNKNLAGGNTASTILNEVTSRNKTELKGFTEIAGDRAKVIIANQNGVYINGAGFINTQKATITTGAVNVQNGSVENYRVDKGTIQIEGDGLNSTNVSKTELYSKVVKLNAKIYAQDIDVVTGKNVISKDGNIEKIDERDTEKPQLSLDSSSLGGIYANKISLIGTQDGVGINLPIEISAQDDLKISADGKISLDKAVSNKNIEIKSNSNDVNTNIVYANSVNIEARNEINNKDIIASKTDISLKAKTVINENLIASGVNEDLSDSSKGNLNISSEILENKKTLYAKDDLNINSKDIKNSNKAVNKAANINIKSDKLELKNGQISAKNDLNIINTTLIDLEDSTVQANKIDIKTDELILSNEKNSTADVKDSKLISNTRIDINVNSLKNVNGYIGAYEDIVINSENLDNNFGTIVSKGDLTINQELPIYGVLNNSNALLQSLDNNVFINAYDINAQNSSISAKKSIDIFSNSLIGSLTAIVRDSNLTINTIRNITLLNSYLQAKENLNLNSNENNISLTNTGIIGDNVNLKGNIITTNGEIQSQTNDNMLYASNDINISANSYNALNSNLQASNDINIIASNTNLNNAKLQSVVDINESYENRYKQGNINLINSNLNILNDSKLASKNINIKNINNTNTQDVIINNSVLDVNNDINVKSKNLNLNKSSLLSLNNINIENSSNVIINDEVKIEASNDLQMDTNNLSILFDNNQLIANNNLNLNVLDKFVNFGPLKSKNTTLNTNYVLNYGLISALNNLTINANDIDNKAGISVVDLQNENQKDSILTINANNLTNYNTIYVNGDMNLNIKNQLLNKTDNSVVNIGIDKATIFAVNNLNIGNEDLRTNKVINDKSIIQTQNGDINVFADSLENLASEPKVYGEYIEQEDGSKYIAGGERISENSYRIDLARNTFNDYFVYIDKMTYEKPEIAQILSGRDIYFNTNNINNKYSLISGKNDLYFKSNVLSNSEMDIVQVSTTIKNIYTEERYCGGFSAFGACSDWDHRARYRGTVKTYDTEIIDTISSTIEAGGTFRGTFGDVINGNENVSIASRIYVPTQTLKNTKTELTNEIKNTEKTSQNEKSIDLQNKVIVLNSIDETFQLPTNKYGMFTTVNPNKNLNYLIESNPLYTNLSNFVGSQYFIDKMNYQGDRIVKRLGDAAYETKLITDSIVKQTGQRFLGNYTSENAQFVALMNNAINLSGILSLEIGQALTSTQLATLTEDIVWMEEKIVAGEKVLVPVVYLARDYEYLKGASIVASKGIELNVKNSVVNSGTIKSKDYLTLNAKSITNNSGVILSNGKASLISTDDFINKNGGIIKASDVQIASINGNIINETFSKQNTINNGANNFTYTQIGNQSQIEATNGNLVIQANNNIENIGADLSASKTLSLNAQTGDVNFKTLSLENGHNVYFKGGFDKALDVEHLSSTASGENVVIKSGKDINLEAAKLNATNQINLNAANDVNILAVNDEHYKDVQTSKKGMLSKKTSRDMTYKEDVVSSELNAKDIIINGTNDVTLQSAKLNSQDNLIANAQNGNLNVVAKEYKEADLHSTSKSSFGGLRKSLDISSSDAVKLKSADLITTNKDSNVVLTSGKDINVLASNISSAGNINLKAVDNVNISSQAQYDKNQEVHEKSSFNLAGLTALVGGNQSIYTQEVHNKDNANVTQISSNLNAGNNIVVNSGTTNIIGSNLEANNIAIKADTGSINVLNAQDMENSSSLDKKVDVKLNNVIKGSLNSIGGLSADNTKLKVNVASATYDEEKVNSNSNQSKASNLTARDGNVVLDSLTDINVTGSNIKAKDTIALSSTVGDINISNSTDTNNQTKDEKHVKAELNLTAQNEYVETAQAVKSLAEATQQLKQTKDDYSNYKSEVKKLEVKLSQLETSYKNKEVGVDYTDIEDLRDIIDNVKSQDKYYKAAISAAGVNVASKSAAVVSQANAAALSAGTAGFSAGVSLDVNGNKTNTNSNSTTSNASALEANNIFLQTNKDLPNTSINVTGSNIIAQNNLGISTSNLNVIASQDTASQTQDSKSINGSIAFTMYGGGGGTAGLGYGQQNSQSDSLVNHNSTLQAKNMNITTSNDANFIGANVRANDTLNLNVGNNLNLESLRDEYTSNSKGFNVNAGIGFGSAGAPAKRSPSFDVGKQSSTNAGFSVNNGTTLNKQTVLSSITANNLNVDVQGNTNLKGSLIASGNFDENNNFIDNKNLNFTTNTLSFENMSNTSYSSNQSIGLSANYNLDSAKVVDNKSVPQQGGISSASYNASNGINVNASKTLATLGQGNINIKDTANSDDLERLNTDTSKINKDLYSSSTGTKVDATLDTRLLTEDGRKQIAEDIERTKRLGQAIGDVASSDSLNIKDTFDHIDDVQKDLDVQKALALKDKGQTISILENQQNYSQEQINIALNNYAQIYADVYGVNIENAKMAILNGKYGSTYTNKDNTNSNVYLDKGNNQNALNTANTLGHEVSHVRQNQGQTYLRDTTQLQEEYANLFGNYSSSGLDFSSYVYNNVKLDSNRINSLNSINDLYSLYQNSVLYKKDVAKADSGDGRIDDSINKISIKIIEYDKNTNYGIAKVYVDGEDKPKEISITSGNGSKDYKEKDKGPTPEGSYVIDPNKSQNMSLYDRIGGTNQSNNELSLFNFIRKYREDWGIFRVPLEPKEGTNTYNRTDMYIHGGTYNGSAGCIDCGNNNWLFKEIRDTKQNIPVEIDYGKNYKK